MAWSSPDAWPTRLFSGDPLTILFAVIITISLPILVHLYFYATSTQASSTPLFLLFGPPGSGKTSLLSLLQGVSSSEDELFPPSTRTSQTSSIPVLIQLPSSIPLASNKYRSTNDDESSKLTPYSLIDTPGHPKLRPQALTFLSNPSLRGVIFVIDAATIDSTDTFNLRDAASYLHDVLLTLQRQKTSKTTKNARSISLLLAANKQDLFTALPPGAIKSRLEDEIDRVRSSRSHGLVSVGGSEEDEPEEALGGDGEAKFSFKMLREEYGLGVDVVGGSVSGEEKGKGVRRWEEWIGTCL